MSTRILVVGISGVTCGGKSTIAEELHKQLPKSRLISQDDYFFNVEDPRHTWIKDLNHINFDILSSLDMEKMHNDILEIIGQRRVISTKLDKNHMKLDSSVLIIEGFSIFNYAPIVPLFTLKYYFVLDKSECLKRRSQRLYEPPDCPGYFQKCVWPQHLKHLKEVRKQVRNVRYFDGTCKNALEEISKDIDKYVGLEKKEDCYLTDGKIH